jgi:hypothetical protein
MVTAALRNLVVMAWIAAGLYLGLAGYLGTKLFETTSSVKVSSGVGYLSYGGLSFATKQDLQDYLLDETASRWFTWLPDIPAEMMPLLACSAWGMLGAALTLLYFRLSPDKPGADGHVLLSPIFGALMALVVYFLAFLFPTVLTVGPHTMRAETIVALSIISGVGYRQVYQWVRDRVGKMSSSTSGGGSS